MYIQSWCLQESNEATHSELNGGSILLLGGAKKAAAPAPKSPPPVWVVVWPNGVGPADDWPKRLVPVDVHQTLQQKLGGQRRKLKTLFNIVEERIKKLLNFDVSAV